MKKFFFTLILVFLWLGIQAQTNPKDTLVASYDNYMQFNVQATNSENETLVRITQKAGYFRYGLIGFDLSKVSSVRQKIELGLYVYSSVSDDFFKSAMTTYPLNVFALKRKPKLPTSYGIFFGSATATPPGDGFVLKGTMPKFLDTADAELVGNVIVTKNDNEKFLRVDITNYLNNRINNNDSVFFFLASASSATDLGSLYIKTTAAGPASGPRIFLYEEKQLALIQGGRSLFAGEKDDVKIFFPKTATPPFSVTYTDGTTPVTVSDIQSYDYKFTIAPTHNVTYSLSAASDAKGTMELDGTAAYTVIAPSATISGGNKIYQGNKTSILIDFKGIAPYSFSYVNDKGETVTQTGITTAKYSFDVAPTVSYTYSLLSAGDANNTSVTLLGNAVVTVMNSPLPVLAGGADQWSVILGEEFATNRLDETRWGIVRGEPQVKGDELHLMVTKQATSNVASQIKLLEKLPNNVDLFLEARIKPLNEKGTYTSFATQTYDTKLSTKYENRYGMSFPSMEWMGDNAFELTYAMEDWKTAYYIKDINPDVSFNEIREKIESVTVADYKVFGIAITRDDIIFYIDGNEVKRGSQMPGFNSSDFINALKVPGSIFEDVAQKGYGYYGQDDWSYKGGYAGDYMSLLLGVSLKDAEVESSVVGKYAAVDYFRVFKRTKDTQVDRSGDITFDHSVAIDFVGDAKREDTSLSITNGSALVSLNNQIDLSKEGTYYFSSIMRKEEDSDLSLLLCDDLGKTLAGMSVDNYNQLLIGFGDNKLYYASTVSAEPVGRKNMFYRNGEAYLMVGRLEVLAAGDDYFSLSLFPLMGNIEEPYFYNNIDGDYGHTSLNNDWDINYKYEIGTGKIAKVKFDVKRNEAFMQKFLVGTSFKSVIPQESLAQFSPGLDYISPGDQVQLNVLLKGNAPWSLTYSDGKEQHSVNNITTPELKITVSPHMTTTYTLTSLVDGNGMDGIVFGEHRVKVKSEDAMSLFPLFDTYVRADQSSVVYCNDLDGQIKKDATFSREAYLRFDISEFTAKDSIDVASFSLFFRANDKGAPVVLSLSSVEGGLPGDIEDLCWANRPDDVNLKHIGDITVPNPGFYGVRGAWDVTKFVNNKLKSGAGLVDFHLRLTGGETTSLLSWVQFRPDTMQLAAQFPLLELDPYKVSSVLEQKLKGNLKIYPNPVQFGTSFRIDMDADNAVVNIYDLNGILRNAILVKDGVIEITDLPVGHYVIEAIMRDKVMRSQLLVR